MASALAHAILRAPAHGWHALPLAFVVLAVSTGMNYTLVATALSLEHGYSFRDVVARLRLGTLSDFLLTFAGSAVLAGMLVLLYESLGVLALIAFFGPTLLIRQLLLRSQMFMDASRAYRSREGAILAMNSLLSKERSDERHLIAADLHDEVLQPLFKVTLMAQVLKSELATGRLLELDEDLPEMLAAAELAASALRTLIGGLRRSAVGWAGLPTALERLIRDLQRQSSAHIHSSIQDVHAGAGVELALYQIAKEGLANSLTHARATKVSISLEEKDDSIVLTLTDDGIGFDPWVQPEGHYGVAIMRERASAIGGSLFVDSAPGQGCELQFSVPRDATLN